MAKEKKKGQAGLAEKAGFFLYSTAVNMAINFKSTYYKYFLTSVLLINPVAVSNMMLIGTIWDIVNDPLIGVWTNNVKFRSGEKIRPWIIWSALPYALGMMFIFCDFGISEKWDIIVGMVVFFLYEIANTLRGIVYNGMGAVTTESDNDRKSINAFRSLGVTIGVVIGTALVPAVIKVFGGLRDHKVINSSDAPALFKGAAVMGAVIVLSGLYHYFTVRERVRQTSDDDSKIGFAETYRILFGCKSWVMNMIYVMVYGISTCLVTSSISYYCAYVINDSSKVTPIMGAYMLFAILFSVVTPKIDSLLGRRKAAALAAIIVFLGKIPFVIDPRTITNTYIASATSGIGLTMTFIIYNMNRNKIADIVEIQSGRRLDTMVSTADSLMSKISEMSVDKVFLVALAAAGFNASLSEQGMEQNIATQNTICALMGWVAAAAAFAMFVVALLINTEKEYRESALGPEKNIA